MLFPFYAFCFAVAGGLAAQHNITVDDADPSISYAGSGWVETNLTDLSLANAYNATFHIACPIFGAKSTSSATFNFTGTTVLSSLIPLIPPQESLFIIWPHTFAPK
jgi:hypothetical protein